MLPQRVRQLTSTTVVDSSWNWRTHRPGSSQRGRTVSLASAHAFAKASACPTDTGVPVTQLVRETVRVTCRHARGSCGDGTRGLGGDDRVWSRWQ